MQSWMDLCYRASKAGIPWDLLLRAAEDLKEVSDCGPALYVDCDDDVWLREPDGSVTLMWRRDPDHLLGDGGRVNHPLDEAEKRYGLIPIAWRFDA